MKKKNHLTPKDKGTQFLHCSSKAVRKVLLFDLLYQSLFFMGKRIKWMDKHTCQAISILKRNVW